MRNLYFLIIITKCPVRKVENNFKHNIIGLSYFYNDMGGPSIFNICLEGKLQKYSIQFTIIIIFCMKEIERLKKKFANK